MSTVKAVWGVCKELMKGDMAATGSPLTGLTEPSSSDRRMVAVVEEEEQEDGGDAKSVMTMPNATKKKRKRKKPKAGDMYRYSEWRVYSGRDVVGRKRWLEQWAERVGRVDGGVTRRSSASRGGGSDGDGNGASSHSADSRHIREELDAIRVTAGTRLYGLRNCTAVDLPGIVGEDPEVDTHVNQTEVERHGFDFSRVTIPKAQRPPGWDASVGLYHDDLDSPNSSTRTSTDDTHEDNSEREDWKAVAHFPLTLKPKTPVMQHAKLKHTPADRDRGKDSHRDRDRPASSTPPSSGRGSWPDPEHLTSNSNSHRLSHSNPDTPFSSRSSGLLSHPESPASSRSEYAQQRRLRNPRPSIPLDEHALLFSPALSLKAERTTSPFSLADFGYGSEASGSGTSMGAPRRVLQKTREVIDEARIAFYPSEEKERLRRKSVGSSSFSAHALLSQGTGQAQSGLLTPELRQPGSGLTNGHERSSSLPNPRRIPYTSTEQIEPATSGARRRTSSLNLTAVTKPSAGVDRRPAGWKHHNANTSSLSMPFVSEVAESSGSGSDGQRESSPPRLQLPRDIRGSGNGHGNGTQAYVKTRVEEIEGRNGGGDEGSSAGGSGGNGAAGQPSTAIGFPFRMHSPPLVKRKSLPQVKRKSLPPGAAIKLPSGAVRITDTPQTSQSPKGPQEPQDLAVPKDKGKGKGKARIDSGQYESGRADTNRGTDKRTGFFPGGPLQEAENGDELGTQEKRELIRTAAHQARRTLWPEGETEYEYEAWWERERPEGQESEGQGSNRRKRSVLRDVGSSEKAEWSYRGCGE